MLKYCFLINEETGLVQLGAGCSDEYYIEIGMEKRDVDQSDIDFQWYLSEKCPMKTEEQKFQEAKEAKYNEANFKAKAFLETGEAVYELSATRHIEATDGNIGKFGSYVLGYITGEFDPDDTVAWTTKEDEAIELTQTQVGEILKGLGTIQSNVWTVQFPAYVAQIETATTIEEIKAIIINYLNV